MKGKTGVGKVVAEVSEARRKITIDMNPDDLRFICRNALARIPDCDLSEGMNGFTLKENFRLISLCNSATAQITYRAGNLLIDVSNVGFGPIQSRHVEGFADQVAGAIQTGLRSSYRG